MASKCLIWQWFDSISSDDQFQKEIPKVYLAFIKKKKPWQQHHFDRLVAKIKFTKFILVKMDEDLASSLDRFGDKNLCQIPFVRLFCVHQKKAMAAKIPVKVEERNFGENL